MKRMEEKEKAAMNKWRQKINGRCHLIAVLTKRRWDSVEEMKQDTKYLTRINLMLIVTNAIILLLHLVLNLAGQR